LFEAMAGGLPFMTTDVGNSVEIIDWSGGGVVMPTSHDHRGFGNALIEPSARLLEDLYSDPDRRRRLGREGRKAWRERFTWRA
jgi:glycosyltransferase involved in cell wall biosynthesis